MFGTQAPKGTEWSMIFCPEMNEGLHEPRAVKLLPRVSVHQTEVEIEVVCQMCGAKGLATLELTPENVVKT
jgi:hypothetical protein